MKYFCGTRAVGTGASPAEVQHGFQGRLYKRLYKTFILVNAGGDFELCSLLGWAS